MSTRREIRIAAAQLVSGKEIEHTANPTGGTTSTFTDIDLVTRYPNNSALEGYTSYIPLAVLPADEMRRVASYVATTGVVTLAAPVLSAATIYNGAVYELHGMIHPSQMHQYINEALKRIPVIVDYNFAPVANNYDQDITAQQSTIVSPHWIRQVYKMATEAEQIQILTETGSPGGGTFTVTYKQGTSGAIAYDATAATVQTALRLLPELGAVTVTRTGTTTNFIWTVRMVGAGTLVGDGTLYMPVMSANSASLTGGSSPTVTPTIDQDAPVLWPLSGEAVSVGARIYIHLNERCETTDRIYIKSVKWAYDHCRASSTGTFGSQSGLTAEAHEAVPIKELVALKTLLVAAEQGIAGSSKDVRDVIMQNRRQWVDQYNQRFGEHYNLQSNAPRTFRNIMNAGLPTIGNPSHSRYSRWW